MKKTGFFGVFSRFGVVFTIIRRSPPTSYPEGKKGSFFIKYFFERVGGVGTGRNF